MRVSHATDARALAVLGSTIALIGCGGALLAPGGDNDSGSASGVGIFATVNGEQQTFTNELAIPSFPSSSFLAADNLDRGGALIIKVTPGATSHQTYACGGSSVTIQYWPPDDASPSAPFLADGEHGACTITYDLTDGFFEGSFTGTLSPAAGGPAAFTMSGTFRLHD